MAFRWIEVVAERDRMDAVRSAAEEAGVSEMLDGPDPGDGRASLRLLAGEIDRQALLDDIQGMLGQGGNWRIVLTDTEAVIPHTEAEKELEAEREARRVQNSRASSREEVYNNVARGARLDIDYLVLVALSTVVAGIGLATDSAAVVIGAMVIAPLLGPNLALSLAIAIGDRGSRPPRSRPLRRGSPSRWRSRRSCPWPSMSISTTASSARAPRSATTRSRSRSPRARRPRSRSRRGSRRRWWA